MTAPIATVTHLEDGESIATWCALSLHDCEWTAAIQDVTCQRCLSAARTAVEARIAVLNRQSQAGD